MRVRLQMLAKKILAVVIAVGSSHDDVDVLARRYVSRTQMTGTDWSLMIELDQNHRTVDAIIKDTVIGSAANPSTGGRPSTEEEE